MPRSVLLDPNNRLLGGATADFGLFGSQPATHITVIAPTTGTTIDDLRPDRIDSDTNIHSTTVDALGDAAGDATQVPTAGEPLPTASILPPAPTQGMTEAPAHSVSEGVAQTVGSSGTFVPQPHQTGNLAAPGPSVTPAADTHAAPSTDATALPAAPAITAVPVAAGMVHYQPVLANAAVAHLADGTDLVSGLTAPALDGAQATLDTASDLAHATIDTALDVFAGTDPAAGVSTLLGLVESNEMAVIGPVTDPAHAEPATSILDTLTADMPIGDALLGDHGLGDHAADVGGVASILDHHDGLGGL